MIENIRVAFSGLSSNKLRTVLTMLGITIGVASVVLLISLGQAFEAYIFDQFSTMGSDLVYVFGSMDNRGRVQPMTEDDLKALQDTYRVPDAYRIMPFFDISDLTGVLGLPVVYQGKEITLHVLGAPPLYMELSNRYAVMGRIYTEAENLGGARVAVIGQRVVENLFDNANPIGKRIRVEDTTVEVIGVLNEVGGGFGPAADFDNLVFLPLTTAQQRLRAGRDVSGEHIFSAIGVEAPDQSRVEALAEQIRQVLREERGIKFRDEDDFEVVTMEEMLSSFSAITGILTIFLGVVAGISLLVGGIGIMNIMLVTVTERTHEIGLRKAVGAQNFDILLQFLTESVVLALIGGAIGVSIAWGSTRLVAAAVPNLDAAVQISSVAFATLISLIIGVFFGIYPANRAAHLNPIDALRYE